jgi:hypothetical protein
VVIPDLRPDPEPSRPRVLHLAHPRTPAPPWARASGPPCPLKRAAACAASVFSGTLARALRRRHRTLARRHRLRSSAPSLFSRYGAVPQLRRMVRKPPVSRIGVLVLCIARARSPEVAAVSHLPPPSEPRAVSDAFPPSSPP